MFISSYRPRLQSFDENRSDFPAYTCRREEATRALCLIYCTEVQKSMLSRRYFISCLLCFKLCKCKTSIFIDKQNGNTALAFASFEGHLEVVRELVKYGANVNFRLNVSLLMHEKL